ncbi:MAG: phosphoglucosamine mutase [Dehalococcoidales bacterium]|nr:phosphoglucosamine mutase [Dehalococcoidales bacterium]
MKEDSGIPLFGTSGIRREVDRDFIQLAFQVGMAVGILYDNVIIGRDTRTTGSAIQHSVISGLLASGARCSDTGILPTPTLAFAAREFKAGVMITASHNPPNYNGIKLLNPDGSAFSPAQQKEIEDLIHGGALSIAPWNKIQDDKVYNTAVEKHVSRILTRFSGGFKLKVVVDAGCGAGFFITPHVLARLGCDVTTINCYPNGIFPHDVEPVEANLGDLMRAVIETKAALGIAHDGDADRMMAIDDRGRFISGDKMLAILSRAAGAKKIVTTIDASMSIDEMGFKVLRTRVGDPYVSEELKKGGEFGGEPSGAWVFPQVSFCPDGIFAAAQIAAIASENMLSILVDSIPAYPVIRGSFKLNALVMPDLEKELEATKPLTIDRTDGFKLNFNDGWLLVRPSGTEPKIRLSAEANTEARAHQIYENGVQAIRYFLQEESK